MPKYQDGVDRMKALMHICPEYANACTYYKFGTFRKENPPLSIACSIYTFTYNADPAELTFELESWVDETDPETLSSACVHLTRFFAESNEPECTMTVLRWMQENGYAETAESPFRL